MTGVETVAPKKLPVTFVQVIPAVSAIAPEQLSFAGIGSVTQILKVPAASVFE